MSSSATACSTCAARCCVEYTVTVIGSDVWRIAANLNLAPQDFLVYFPTRDDAPNGFKLEQSATLYDLALDKAPVDEQRRPCVFLVGLPGGGGRCGIHAHRPEVCQTYPAFLNGEVVTLRNDVLCPEGAWKLSQMRVGSWRERLEAFLAHRDVYERVVACWNERVDAAAPGRTFTIAEFFDFLMNVYGRIEQLWAALDDDQRTTVRREWREARVASRQSPLARGAPRTVRAGLLEAFVDELRELLAEYAPLPRAAAAVASPAPREAAARAAV